MGNRFATIALLGSFFLAGTAYAQDTDGDGVADATDNCRLVANPLQTDGDSDNIGNQCDADISNDCIVNVVDLGIFRTRFFTPDATADFNVDGVVNVLDLGILRTLFFSAPRAQCKRLRCGRQRPGQHRRCGGDAGWSNADSDRDRCRWHGCHHL